MWLFALAAMVFVMVVIGGLTRLTNSGLSMVEWRPVTGWLPPLSDAAWEATFRAYQATPEYRHVNAGMSVAEFKGIFWLEYIHRLWGRLIGVAFFVPFIFFLARGWLDRKLAPRLALVFVLGGLQGALGWFMVASGLVDRPDVSQYRLVAHFAAALIIYVALLWIGLGLVVRTPPWNPSRGLGRGRFRRRRADLRYHAVGRLCRRNRCRLRLQHLPADGRASRSRRPADDLAGLSELLREHHHRPVHPPGPGAVR